MLSQDLTHDILSNLGCDEECAGLLEQLFAHLLRDEKKCLLAFFRCASRRVRVEEVVPITAYVEARGSRVSYGPMTFQYLPRNVYLVLECLRLCHNADLSSTLPSLHLITLSAAWLRDKWTPCMRAWIRNLTPGTVALSVATECCICTEPLLVGRTLRCAHSFHEDCITKWLERSFTCPLCRRSA